MLVKAIFFDLDGTLAESTASLYGVYSEFLSLFGIVGTGNEFDELNGKNIVQIVALLKKRYELAENTDELIEKYQDAVSRAYVSTRATLGADTLLRSLYSDGYILGLVTSAPRLLAESFVKQQGWERLFSVYACGDEVIHTKPDPEIYLKAIALSGERSEEIIAIEDSENGVRSASLSGIRTIGLAPEGGEQHLLLAGADTTITTLSKVPVLLSLWKEESCRVISTGNVALYIVPADAGFIERQSANTSRIEMVWNTLSRERAIFNGAVLSVSSITQESGLSKVYAHIISYKDFLAERQDPSIKLGIRPIGVIGILIVRDAQDVAYTVFARRTDMVTQYPKYLELVPSGSIDAKRANPDGTVSYESQIAGELEEETGITSANITKVQGFALVYDARDHVYDICCLLELSLPKEEVEKIFRDSAEYEQPSCIPNEELEQFIATHQQEIVPSSLALLSAYRQKLLQ